MSVVLVGEFPAGPGPDTTWGLVVRTDRFGDPRHAPTGGCSRGARRGSHGTGDELVRAGRIDPTLVRLHSSTDAGRAHRDMGAGTEVFGNRVALIGAPEPGRDATAPVAGPTASG